MFSSWFPTKSKATSTKAGFAPSKGGMAVVSTVFVVALVPVILYFAYLNMSPVPPAIVVAPPAAPVTAPLGAKPARMPQARPMSTPTMLASKNGLGGGPFVGTQSLKTGGSKIEPVPRVHFTQNVLENRRPSNARAPSPPPPPPPAPVAVTAEPPAQPRRRRRFWLFGEGKPTPYGRPTEMIVDSRDGLVIQPRR